MDILTLFIVVPVLTILALVFTRNLKQSRVVAASGMLVQFAMSINLIFAYVREKQINDDIMVFTRDLLWFETFNIHYAIGVDGISVAMIVLASIVVLAGVFISWKMEDLPKELPEVAAYLKDGLWTTKAERKLLEVCGEK